jgi:serine/threonine-protein kinase
VTSSRDELIGKLVLGRYRVIQPLARGGMGMVYLGRIEGAAGFSKPVVIKRVLPHLTAESESSEQFAREARILSNLQHPGIVGVLDFGEVNQAYVMVLEYVHGYHLGYWLRYVLKAQGRMSWELATLVIVRVLDALSYAHSFRRSDGTRAEVIHRDISPGNILLDVDGNVRLVDFGIARMADEAGEYRTQDGVVKGKLPFVPPEIYASQPPSVRSDIYTCGVVLYQLLTGRNPFSGRDMTDTISRVVHYTAPPVAAIREDVPPVSTSPSGSISGCWQSSASNGHTTVGPFNCSMSDQRL